MGILGSCIVYWVMPFFGIEYEGWIPTVYLLRVAPFGGFESFFLISTLFALIGYNAVGLFKYKKARPDICN
jgi:hypothetical protein